MARIREETPEDAQAIRELNQIAFGGDREADLIEQLRLTGSIVTSLVAEERGSVCGHVLFSELPIDTANGEIAGVSLGPMAVRSELQRRGIGTALIAAGLIMCRERGKSVAAVLGHSDYYPRFGFSAGLGERLRSPFSEAGNAWMAMELVEGALDGVTGEVRYPAAFGDLVAAA